MNGIEALLVLLFLTVLVLGAWLVESLQTHHAPGRAARIATWGFVTALWLAGGSMLLFVVSHLLLFTLGTEAATVGLIASLLILIAVPFAWWRWVRASENQGAAAGRAQLKR